MQKMISLNRIAGQGRRCRIGSELDFVADGEVSGLLP
jgi:hypothetical protein